MCYCLCYCLLYLRIAACVPACFTYALLPVLLTHCCVLCECLDDIGLCRPALLMRYCLRYCLLYLCFTACFSYAFRTLLYIYNICDIHTHTQTHTHIRGVGRRKAPLQLQQDARYSNYWLY